MPLWRYIFRRVLSAVLLLFAVTLVAFVIAYVVPTDPINANLSQRALADPRIVQAFREEWGLDKSPVEQYLTYLGNLARGNLGRSISTRRPVWVDVRRFLPATIELATVAMVIGVTLGILQGVVSAVWRGRPIDVVARTLGLLGTTFPIFGLALLGLAMFHVKLGLVPGPGRLDFALTEPPMVTGLYTVDSLIAGRWATFRNAAAHLVLPSFVLGYYVAGLMSRVTRAAMLEILGMDYLQTARAKGLREQAVVARHGLRNALLPIVTVVGQCYGSLLTGAVLTEWIFAWPGIGRYMFRASVSQDFPAIMGVSLAIAVMYLLVNLLVDLAYYHLDPRVRTS